MKIRSGGSTHGLGECAGYQMNRHSAQLARTVAASAGLVQQQKFDLLFVLQG